MSPAELVVALVTGFVAGGFAGAMGVGGGVIMVPVLTEVIGFDQRTAQGTSLAVIIATAVVATVSAHRRGLLDVPIALRVAAGGLLGAVGGALLATRVLDATVLRRAFGALVLLTALRLLLQIMKPGDDTETPATESSSPGP